MPLLDPYGFDPNKIPQGGSSLPGYVGGSQGQGYQATPTHVTAIPRGPGGQPITGDPSFHLPGDISTVGSSGAPHQYANPGQIGSSAVQFSSNPYGSAPEYGGNLSPGDPGRKAWQQWVGNTDNWIQREMGTGHVVEGAPAQFQGDINSLNRYGQFGINPNGTVPVGQIQYVNGVATPSTETRPATQAEMQALNQYQNYAYGQENQPGGGGVAAWGQQQGYGNNPAADTWGGTYSAYMAQQSINAGVAPGTGYGFGTTAGSSPLGHVQPGMPGAPQGAVYYNATAGGNIFYDQYGRPIGQSQAPNFTTNTEDVFQSRLDAQNRANQNAPPPPPPGAPAPGASVPSGPAPYDPYKNPRAY